MGKKLTSDAAQQWFRSVLEENVNQLLGSKLVGKFKAVAAPQGVHWCTTYSAMDYGNKMTLEDFDRTLTFDNGELARFGDETFSGLYEKILENVTFQYSDDDKREMDKLKEKADMEAPVLVHAYQNAGFTIKEEKNPLPEIINLIWEKMDENPEKFKNVYGELYSAYLRFSASNKRYCAMAEREMEALNRLDVLKNNMEQPSEENGGVKIAAETYAVGYRLPDKNAIYNSLKADDNKIKITLDFSEMTKEGRTIQINHQGGFVVPSLIFVFGRSNTKHRLEEFVTESSKISITMEYRGITALEASPMIADSKGKAGWYDGNLLWEIKEKTGKDETGYSLQNKEFDVGNLFGEGKRLNRMKEFVISQEPVITIKITDSRVEEINEFFTHDSAIDVDFFGFAISSSDHHYSTSECEVDTEEHTATIVLSSPVPEISQEEQNKVAYIMGGVIVYPPEMPDILEARRTSPGFTCMKSEDDIFTAIRAYTPGWVRRVYVRHTDYTGHHYEVDFDGSRRITVADTIQWIENALGSTAVIWD